MNKKSVLLATKARLKYMNTVAGFSAYNPKSVNDLIETFQADSEEILQFKNCGKESYDELQRLLIEMCANVIYMSNIFDIEGSEKSDEVLDKITDGIYPGIFELPRMPFPDTMIDPPLNSNNPLYGLSNNYNIKKAMSNLILVIGGNDKLPTKTGKVSDGSLKENEYEKIPLSCKTLIKSLSHGDHACINGLTRIICEFSCLDIVQEMSKIGLNGRTLCLGFMAKLCKYDVIKMKAVIDSWKRKEITKDDIKSECIEYRGKRFDLYYIVARYKMENNIK